MRAVIPLLALVLVLPGCSDEQSATPLAPPSASPSASQVAPVDPLSPRPPLESAAPLGGPTCDAAQLRVTDADLLADERALEEVFAVRTTGPACALRGWPAVTLLDGAGRPIPVATRNVRRAGTVTLSAGTSVSFVLSTPRSTSCRDVTTLAVRLPGTRGDLRAATTMQVCAGALSVGPVERRQDDEGSEG
ncbi:MAG TPA: DUF4232 domain-containing protein [Mycobacteriales bacterium]|nr:DUF4232 domain-containing protein [Mycobacteriales bacterium]